jgi:hypothetical protein
MYIAYCLLAFVIGVLWWLDEMINGKDQGKD